MILIFVCRLWPVYNWTVYNGSLKEPYKNPGAPAHLISGSAGCFSKHNPFLNQTQLYSAFRSFSIFKANSTASPIGVPSIGLFTSTGIFF